MGKALSSKGIGSPSLTFLIEGSLPVPSSFLESPPAFFHGMHFALARPAEGKPQCPSNHEHGKLSPHRTSHLEHRRWYW